MSLQVSARGYDKDGHRLNILSKKLCGLSSRVFQRMWELETSSMRLITIEWIIDRYQCSKDKDSQIVYAPTDRAREHNEAKYILNLLKSIITVSPETMNIVKSLPVVKAQKPG
jgi:hypothetical protein